MLSVMLCRPRVVRRGVGCRDRRVRSREDWGRGAALSTCRWNHTIVFNFSSLSSKSRLTGSDFFFHSYQVPLVACFVCFCTVCVFREFCFVWMCCGFILMSCVWVCFGWLVLACERGPS